MTLITWFIPSAIITTITTTTTTLTPTPTCTSANDDGLTLKDIGLTTSSGPNTSGAPPDNTGRDTLIITAIGDITATGVMATMVIGGTGGNRGIYSTTF